MGMELALALVGTGGVVAVSSWQRLPESSGGVSRRSRTVVGFIMCASYVCARGERWIAQATHFT